MSRLIDADVFAKNVVKYSHQSTKTIGQALADTPTIKAVPIEVLQEIKDEINGLVGNNYPNSYYVKIIDKHLKDFNA